LPGCLCDYSQYLGCGHGVGYRRRA
jgi:hypothetical protein